MIKNIIIGVLVLLCVMFFFFGFTQHIAAEQNAELARRSAYEAENQQMMAEANAKEAHRQLLIAEQNLLECTQTKKTRKP